MPKGLRSLGETKDAREAAAGSKMGFLELKAIGPADAKKEDAKIARIRFLTDWDDSLVWGCFHNVPAVSRMGKAYKKEVYCERSSGDKDAKCIHCEDENPKTAWTSIKFFLWVWAYEIYHLKQDAEKKWKETEYLGDTYFVEPVNALKILKTGPGKEGYIETRFGEWMKRKKTLTDRDYDWCRNGVGLETMYDLVPRDEKTALSAEQKKTLEELPDLEEIAFKKKKPKEDAKKPAKSGKAASAVESMLGGDDDDES